MLLTIDGLTSSPRMHTVCLPIVYNIDNSGDEHVRAQNRCAERKKVQNNFFFFNNIKTYVTVRHADAGQSILWRDLR